MNCVCIVVSYFVDQGETQEVFPSTPARPSKIFHIHYKVSTCETNPSLSDNFPIYLILKFTKEQ